MKYKIFLLVIMSTLITMKAKANNTIQLVDTTVLIQTPAEFPGGQDKWQDFLANNLDYDIAVKNDAPVGKYKVIFAFVIDTEGEIKDIRFVQNPGYGIAEEVLKAINKCPRWIPASQNGKNVIYRHRQELIFEVSQN